MNRKRKRRTTNKSKEADKGKEPVFINHGKNNGF